MDDKLLDLNKIIKSELWYDFHVMSYNGVDLLINGTLDDFYGYNLTILMKNVSYIAAPMEWRVDTTLPVIIQKFEKNDLSDEMQKKIFDKKNDAVIGFRIECFDSSQWIFFATESLEYVYKGKWENWDWKNK